MAERGFWRLRDSVTILSLAVLFLAIRAGDWAVAVVPLLWLGWLVHVFIRDFEAVQAESRREAHRE
jgi:hypothetical protein